MAALQIIFAVGLYGIAALIAKTPAPHHVYPRLLTWPVVVPVTEAGSDCRNTDGARRIDSEYSVYDVCGRALHRAIATGSVLGVSGVCTSGGRVCADGLVGAGFTA